MNKFNLIDFWKSEFSKLNGLSWCDVLLNENKYRKFGG